MRMRNHVMAFFDSYRMAWNNALCNDSDGLMSSRRSVLATDVSARFSGMMTGGTFFTTLLLLVLRDATAVEYGYFIALNAAVQSFAGMAQFLAPFFMERLPRRAGAVNALKAVYHAVNTLLLPLIVALPVPVSAKGYLFVAMVGVMTAANAMCGPAWGVWYMHSLPNERRSDYLMIYQGIGALADAVIAVALSMFMDYVKAGNAEYIGILVMRGLAMALVGAEFYFRRRVVEPVYNEGQEKVSLRDILTAPFASKKFLAVVLIVVIWNFGTGVAAVYYSAYLLDGAMLSYSYISLCGALGVPLSILMLPFWNRVIRKKGWMPALPMALFLFALCYVINGFVTEETKWMYMVSGVFCTLVSGGYLLEFSNLPYIYLPEKMRASCVAFYSLCGSLASFAAAGVASWLYGVTSGTTISLWGLQLENRAYMSVMGFFILALACGVAWLLARSARKDQEEAAPDSGLSR